MKYLVISYAESREDESCSSDHEVRELDTMEEVKNHIFTLDSHKEYEYEHDVFAADVLYEDHDSSKKCIVPWVDIAEMTCKRLRQEREIREEAEKKRLEAQRGSKERRDRKLLAELQAKYG